MTRRIDFEDMADSAEEASEFLKALANPHRLAILCYLGDGEKSVGELESALGLRQPNLSQQLARLRSDNLVTTRRESKSIYYSLASDGAREIISVLYKLYCAPKSRAREAAE